MPEPLEPEAGWDEVADHPGVQCHEAHPERPHRRPRGVPVPPDDGKYEAILQRPVPPNPPGFPVYEPPARVEADELGLPPAIDQTTALEILGSDPWTRFDLWAERAWGFVEQAIAAAKAEGDRNAGLEISEAVKWDPRAQTLIDAARICTDLAQATCPVAALGGLLPKMPTLEISRTVR